MSRLYNVLNAILNRTIDTVTTTNAVIDIGTISAGASKTGSLDVNIPTGYKFLGTIPISASSGLIVISNYVSIGAPTGKQRVSATVYNQKSASQSDVTATIRVLFIKGGTA